MTITNNTNNTNKSNHKGKNRGIDSRAVFGQMLKDDFDPTKVYPITITSDPLP